VPGKSRFLSLGGALATMQSRLSLWPWIASLRSQ
jgi:hypothetical protein